MSHLPTLRSGRALVECCVAMVLLSASATVVLLLANSSAMLVNSALAQDVAQRTLLSHSSALQLHACESSASTTNEAVRNRYTVDGTEQPDGPARHERLRLMWRPSALVVSNTGQTWHELSSLGAALCE
ncbi:hypothetical protein [Gemmatimonas sp. UBA7669]|uniref:hypothetical protein n=1 Tax=Gemmatimonas sp. UBA7669 TaxID=1946568 RepID=UPI0025B929AF|nr:hypothetical protein [Gemmatimonas sp. UBA7669]